MTNPTFPSQAFFDELRRRLGAEAVRLDRLGTIDTAFGVRVLGGHGRAPALYMLSFEAGACTGAAQATDGGGLDFVLEAPDAVWRDMLASRGPDGAIDAAHSLNTLTHHDTPIHVEYADPIGHDKLFRYAESLQLVFDVAAAVAAGTT